MGQFGSSIGIWNQYSKIFRTQYFWIFFGINIPNFNSVNLGPFIEVLPRSLAQSLTDENCQSAIHPSNIWREKNHIFF